MPVKIKQDYPLAAEALAKTVVANRLIIIGISQQRKRLFRDKLAHIPVVPHDLAHNG